jgi:type III secretion system FlhB-like substrate exporter
MRLTALFLVLFLVCIEPNASAQTTAEPTGGISPAKIFEGYLSATGGANAHKELTTLKASGRFGVSGYTATHPAGAYTFLYKAPAKDIFQMQVTSHGTSWAGRRDDHLIRRLAPEEPGFMGIGVGGAGFIKGTIAENVERCLMSLLEWDIHTYKNIELIGRAQVDRRWAYALRFTPQQGDSQVRYYDMENFLMVRMDQLQRYRIAKDLPEKAYAVVTYFHNYRQLGALKLPQEIVISHDPELVFEFTNVKYSEEIPDSAFRD